MKKILFTVNGLRVNGMSAVIMHYIKGLYKNGFCFYIYTDEIDKSFLEDLETYSVTIVQSDSRRHNQLKYYKQLCRYLRKEKIDILHAHGNSATIAIEMLAAKRSGVRVRIAHSHNTTCDHKLLDKLLRPILYKTYNVGIGCGIEAGKWMFGNHEHTIVKNGINLQDFKFDKMKRENTRSSLSCTDKFVIGHVGRFTDQKNHSFLINVFYKYNKYNPNSLLLLVGDGPLEESIKKMVQDFGIDKSVLFYGTTNKVNELYSAMDLFVFPSKYEGVPLTLIEAQSNGLRCLIGKNISDEVVVTKDVIKLDICDSEEWVNMIKLNEHNKRKESDEQIEQLRKAGFDEDEAIQRMKEIYLKER